MTRKIRFIKNWIPFLVFVFIGNIVFAQTGFYDASLVSKSEKIPYLVSLPTGYDSDPNKKQPLLLFLHGGDGSNTKHHPKKYAQGAGLDFPFLVVAPHCNGGCSWSSVDFKALLEEVGKTYSFDKTRVYVTGYSMGGYGTWSAIENYPGLFAAASPIAGGGNSSKICVAQKVAVKAYHGDKDNVIGYTQSQKMVNALKACNAKAELVTIKGGGHGIWPAIYKSEDFYQWFLAQ